MLGKREWLLEHRCARLHTEEGQKRGEKKTKNKQKPRILTPTPTTTYRSSLLYLLDLSQYVWKSAETKKKEEESCISLIV
jgi:hypothetical protein